MKRRRPPSQPLFVRFVCCACGFGARGRQGQSYAEVNYALGQLGWRIEKRPYYRGKMIGWGPVCNKCATPDPAPPVALETVVGGGAV